jgi:hypothetical protein
MVLKSEAVIDCSLQQIRTQLYHSGNFWLVEKILENELIVGQIPSFQQECQRRGEAA